MAHKVKNNPDWLAAVLLVVTLTVSFLRLDNKYIYPLLGFWIALAAGKLVANLPMLRRERPLYLLRQQMHRFGIVTGNHRKIGSVLRSFLKWNFGSQVVVYVYTVCLVVFELTESRFLSTNVMTFMNGLSAASVLYLFERKAVNLSITALCFAWIVSAIRAFVAPQFDNFWTNFELHDMSFGAGYVLLYYLFVNRKWNKFHVICCGIVTLLILLAFKRIGIAALILTAALWVVLRIVDDKKRKVLIIATSLSAVIACYIFVEAIVDGWLFKIFESLDINPMGRNYYYATLAKHCEFAPWFLGLGRNASATLFSTDYSYMNVGNVHSDILRMYAECGFCLYGLWLLVYWCFLPREIEKKFGYNAMEFYILCTVYTFVVYATDNTELYLINQYFYMLIVMHGVMLGGRAGSPLGEKVTFVYGLLRNKIENRKSMKKAKANRSVELESDEQMDDESDYSGVNDAENQAEPQLEVEQIEDLDFLTEKYLKEMNDVSLDDDWNALLERLSLETDTKE